MAAIIADARNGWQFRIAANVYFYYFRPAIGIVEGEIPGS